MRAIKFRAFHKEANEMLYSDTISHVFRWQEDGQPVEIMQFTGLADKNGRDVYEGDIFRDDEYPHDVVVWANEGWCMQHNDGTTDHFHDYYIHKCEVIGNCYEHPDLLQEEGE